MPSNNIVSPQVCIENHFIYRIEFYQSGGSGNPKLAFLVLGNAARRIRGETGMLVNMLDSCGVPVLGEFYLAQSRAVCRSPEYTSGIKGKTCYGILLIFEI